ncbi:MAG: hypothetical protein JST75_06305 [Bacteroidetes bacterium]|nr:hypothetical protein [Bacteroidota bacterium]
MKEKIIKWIFGESVIRVYSSVSVADDIREHVYLQLNDFFIDITENQWLLSLDPVVMGVWLKNDIPLQNKNTFYKIYFTDKKSEKENVKRNSVAIIELEFFDKIEEPNGSLFLLTAIKTRIHYISAIKTFLLFYKFYKKPGLSFDQFKSLAAAHSYPRKVRIISFRENNYYNIFPMDLLGDVRDAKRFVFGLRHTNQSLQKIIESRKIVVSEFSSSHKIFAYQLGKHHTSGPPSMNSLPFNTIQTEWFKFFIPEWVESYREINIIKTINLGSHMLIWGEPVHEEKLQSISSEHLFHIPFLLHLHQKGRGFHYSIV